ncbi:MAG: type III secretion system chaperone [Pseudomonadota bacterium]
MKIKELVSEVGRRAGLGEIDYDPAQGAQFTVGEVTLAVEAMPDGILLTASLGPVPANAPAGFYRALLAANFEPEDTGGTALSINEAFDAVMACRTILQDDLPFEAFEREITVFVNTAETWAAKLRSGAIRTETPPSDSDDYDAVHIPA